MKKFLFRATLILLLVTLLFCGACWFYAEQILDEFVRPRIENLATGMLEAEVRIGQLSWTETGVEILDLHVTAPQRILATVPRIELDFSPGSLWHRQLDALQVSRPEIEIFQTPEAEKPPETTLQIPAKLPLTIKQLKVIAGRLSFNNAGRFWQLHELTLSATLQQQSDFNLSAYFGSDRKNPVALTGSVEFSPQQNLTLNNFSWQSQQLLTSPMQIKLAGTELTLGRSQLRLERFDHQRLQEILTALNQPSPLPEALGFSLTGVTVGFSLEGQTFTVELQVTDGQIDWSDLSAAFTRLNLLINREKGGWRLTGRVLGPANTNLDFGCRLDGENNPTGRALVKIPDPDRLKTTLVGGPSPKISGGLELAAEFARQGEQLKLTFDILGQPSPRPGKDYLLNIAGLNGQGKLLLTDHQEEFALKLRQGSQPLFSASGDFRRLIFTLNPASLEELRQLLAPEWIPEQIEAAKGLNIAGQISRNSGNWAGTLDLTADEIDLPKVALEQIAGHTKLRFTAGQIGVTDLSLDFGFARGEELTAQVSAGGAGEISDKSVLLHLRQLSLAHLNYISADGQTGVGDATLNLGGDISGPWPAGPLALKLNGSLAAREALRKEFYADLSAYRGEYSLVGTFTPATRTLNAENFSFDLPRIGKLAATGQFRPDKISSQAHVEVADLTESFGKQLGPLLSTMMPSMTDLTLAGEMAFDSDLQWQPAGWQINGKLLLRGLNASWEHLRVKLIDATGAIPLALSSEKLPMEETPAAEYPGEISFASLSAGPASLPKGRLLLAAAANRFSVRSPLQLQLAGGRMTIENLTLGQAGNKLQGSVKVNIADVDLETLTQDLGLPVMQGRFSADLGTIRYADRQLRTDGIAGIEVFDGRFQLRNMSFSDPFSSYPIFHTDIDFSGLDLLQATRTFDFGEMNGILYGKIHGLKLFGSTPEAFEAELETRTSGKRNISVKALNNLSILSQGGISAALSRGIYRFIDFYRYRKIGIKCSLENDTFTLTGTALPGSKRYLVYGGLLPPRIDITTSTPTISFKEMLNRLSRIERAGK